MHIKVKNHLTGVTHYLHGADVPELEGKLRAAYPSETGSTPVGDSQRVCHILGNIPHIQLSGIVPGLSGLPRATGGDYGEAPTPVPTLQKSIGYLTFPKLGITSIHHEPKIVTDDNQLHLADKLMSQGQMSIGSQALSSLSQTKGQGAGGEYINRVNPVKGQHNFQQLAWAKEGTDIDLNGVRAHEAQHSVFSEHEKRETVSYHSNRYGMHKRKELAKFLLNAIPSKHQKTLEALNKGADYRPFDDFYHEEAVSQPQNYLMSSRWRDLVHEKLGLDTPDKQREFQTQVKQAWQHLMDVSKKVRMLPSGEYTTLDQSPLSKSEDINLQKVENDDYSEIAQDMAGFSSKYHAEFEAARFLCGSKSEPSLERLRRALWQHDGDTVAAALAAYGIEVNEGNRKALAAVINLGELSKIEINAAPEMPHSIAPLTPEAQKAVDEVMRAWKAGTVQFVQLSGKHSKGTMIARDPQSMHVYLIKPGSGKQSPAAGSREELASQSRREGAFYYVADKWHLGQYVPQSYTIVANGNQEWAAIQMLPWTYKNLEKQIQKDHGRTIQSINAYASEGILHKWAVLDYVLGNPDRHGQNLMIGEKGDIHLIDHGSAFAGDSFAPATDKDSFVPYYLRYRVPAKFNTLTESQKLSQMPRVHPSVEKDLAKWVKELDPRALELYLRHFGLNPDPCVERLEQIKALPSPIDAGINKLWIAK